MSFRLFVSGIAVTALVGCNAPQNSSSNEPAPTAPQAPAAPNPPAAPASPAEPANDQQSPAAPVAPASPAPPRPPLPPRESLPEPRGPIDPKSAEGAGQIVQRYGALIEQRRFGEAESLWSSRASARQFSATLSANAENHLEIGKPGEAEGAAGSIYVTEPVTFYGKHKGGADYRRRADIILRRVNDVPGSTADQRRWHIERIEWKSRT